MVTYVKMIRPRGEPNRHTVYLGYYLENKLSPRDSKYIKILKIIDDVEWKTIYKVGEEDLYKGNGDTVKILSEKEMLAELI
ncbi:MAG: hypothetical protein IMZ52_02315 [Actinobacteria bacterium]|nr:hypothetical protein [Actinomycetota bacterium]MBE3114857.1 hypothetical protein [Actinomycetota bacterium]